MSEISSEQAAGTIAGKYLTFSVSKERYGLEILRVQEIIGVPHITPVPRCASFIKGVINLRGKIIPVFDLRTKFNIPSIAYDEKTCIIVTYVSRGEHRYNVGIIVDTVLEVVTFSAAQIIPTPNYGTQIDSRFIIGMGKSEETLSILVDIQGIIVESDDVHLSEMSGVS